jgi:hypothetical protein
MRALSVLVILSGSTMAEAEDGVISLGWAVEAPKDANDDSAFITIHGRFCTVKTTAPKEAGLSITRYLDGHIQNFRRLFVGRFRIDGKLVVRVFAHSTEFDQRYSRVYASLDKSIYKPRYSLFSPSEHETWVTLQGISSWKTLPEETAKHEITHHLLCFFLGADRIPPWFDEGIACFFQYWNVSQSRAENVRENFSRSKKGDFGYFINELRRAFGGPSFISPKELFKLTYEEFHLDKEKERLLYSESWALVSYLISNDQGKKFLDKAVESLRKGQDPARLLSDNDLLALTTLWYKDLEVRIISHNSGLGKK